jgi:hypothetical protein
MLKFGASLTDDASSVNYDLNMFIIQATALVIFHLINGLAHPIFQKTVRKPPKKKIETMNLPYYELDMVDGTVCDLVSSRLDRFRAAVYILFSRKTL